MVREIWVFYAIMISDFIKCEIRDKKLMSRSPRRGGDFPLHGFCKDAHAVGLFMVTGFVRTE